MTTEPADASTPGTKRLKLARVAECGQFLTCARRSCWYQRLFVGPYDELYCSWCGTLYRWPPGWEAVAIEPDRRDPPERIEADGLSWTLVDQGMHPDERRYFIYAADDRGTQYQAVAFHDVVEGAWHVNVREGETWVRLVESHGGPDDEFQRLRRGFEHASAVLPGGSLNWLSPPRPGSERASLNLEGR